MRYCFGNKREVSSDRGDVSALQITSFFQIPFVKSFPIPVSRARSISIIFIVPPPPFWIFYYVISGVSGVLTCKSASGVQSVWKTRNNRYRPKFHSVFLKMCHRRPRKSTLEYLFSSVNSMEVEEFETLGPKSGNWAGITLEDVRFRCCSNPRFLVKFVNLQSKFQLLMTKIKPNHLMPGITVKKVISITIEYWLPFNASQLGPYVKCYKIFLNRMSFRVHKKDATSLHYDASEWDRQTKD